MIESDHTVLRSEIQELRFGSLEVERQCKSFDERNEVPFIDCTSPVGVRSFKLAPQIVQIDHTFRQFDKLWAINHIVLVNIAAPIRIQERQPAHTEFR